MEQILAWQQRNAIIGLLILIVFLLIQGHEIKVRVATETEGIGREIDSKSEPRPNSQLHIQQKSG